MKSHDTIFAPATASATSAIAIIRISGQKSWDIVENLTKNLPQKKRILEVRWLKTPDGDILDQAMVVIFDENDSFTGEKSAELHLHGSQAIINAVSGILSEKEGVRLAEPGEFTRRALENGRLNLAEAEGLGDLIASQTEMQRRQSLRLFSGQLGKKVEEWREKLLEMRALTEAIIDFSEEDIPENTHAQIGRLLDALIDDLGREIKGISWAERIRTGFEVALIGPPNSGKSTLFNAIAGRDIAIISDIPGTTRDVLELHTDIKGLPVTFLDTAGQRQSTDKIEKIGIERAKKRAEEADLRIILTESADISQIPHREGDFIYSAKADLGNELPFPSISGKTGQGMEAMIERISETFATRANSVSVAVNARHGKALREAVKSLKKAKNQRVEDDNQVEITAEHLRDATRHLESLIGGIDVERILGQIFSKFCIGK